MNEKLKLTSNKHHFLLTLIHSYVITQMEQLVEQAVQILIVTLEHDGGVPHRSASPSSMEEQEVRHREHHEEIKLMNI